MFICVPCLFRITPLVGHMCPIFWIYKTNNKMNKKYEDDLINKLLWVIKTVLFTAHSIFYIEINSVIRKSYWGMQKF